MQMGELIPSALYMLTGKNGYRLLLWLKIYCSRLRLSGWPIVQAMVALAKMGVQIFVTTHDYFVQ